MGPDTREKPLQRLDRIVKELKIQPGSVVLDAGTGTGVLLPLLKEAVGPTGKIVALDFAEEMLLRAREKNGEEKISYVPGDLTATPFDNGTFDEIACNSCFPHIKDKAAAAREMIRILKPGGRATVCHTSSREELNSMHRSIGGVVGNDMLPGDDEMQALFQQAGFASIVITDTAEGYTLTARKPSSAPANRTTPPA